MYRDASLQGPLARGQLPTGFIPCGRGRASCFTPRSKAQPRPLDLQPAVCSRLPSILGQEWRCIRVAPHQSLLLLLLLCAGQALPACCLAIYSACPLAGTLVTSSAPAAHTAHRSSCPAAAGSVPSRRCRVGGAVATRQASRRRRRRPRSSLAWGSPALLSILLDVLPGRHVKQRAVVQVLLGLRSSNRGAGAGQQLLERGKHVGTRAAHQPAPQGTWVRSRQKQGLVDPSHE